jgi:hypothetical protein
MQKIDKIKDSKWKKETDIDEAVLLRLIALRDCRRF